MKCQWCIENIGHALCQGMYGCSCKKCARIFGDLKHNDRSVSK